MNPSHKLQNAHNNYNIVFRFWNEGDENTLNIFYNDPSIRPSANVEGYCPRTNEQWLWEYRPFSSHQPAYVVASHEGKVVGTQAYIPIPFMDEGKLITTGKDEDTLVHPQYRGMGILDKMYVHLFQHAKEKHVAMMWGFTGTAIKPLLRNGYKVIGDLEIYQKNLRFDLKDVKKLFKGKYNLVKATRYFINNIAKKMRANPLDNETMTRMNEKLQLKEIVRPDAECDRFSKKFGQEWGGVTVHLCEDFLKWRVFNNPFKRYKVFAVYNGDDIIGMSIFKFDDKSKEGMVSDLVAIPIENVKLEDVLLMLLRPGLELFASRKYKSIKTIVQGGNVFNAIAEKVIQAAGFSKITTSSRIMVKPLLQNERDDYYCDIKNWRISEILSEY